MNTRLDYQKEWIKMASNKQETDNQLVCPFVHGSSLINHILIKTLQTDMLSLYLWSKEIF